MGQKFRDFFDENNWLYKLAIFLMTMMALASAFSALYVSYKLAEFSAGVATEISDNQLAVARDQRCADDLIRTRGQLSQLISGYNLRPLDREARMTDWDSTKQIVDTVTLSCDHKLNDKTSLGTRYAVLTQQIYAQHALASSGAWDSCIAEQFHEFAGLFALQVLKYPGSSTNLQNFVTAASPCTSAPGLDVP